MPRRTLARLLGRAGRCVTLVMFVAVLSVSGWGGGGCTPPAGGGGPPAGERPRGEIREAVVGSVDSLLPWESDDPAEELLRPLVFSALAGVTAQGEVFPDLAVGWVAGRQGRTWTVRLRPDVFWHDGQPVTADDVTFTLQLLARMVEGGLAPSYSGRQLPEGIAWERVDIRTIRFSLPYADANFPYRLACIPILPARMLKAGPDSEAWRAFRHQPVGCGPFRLVGWEGERLLFEAHRRYHRGLPKVGRLCVYAYSDPVTAVAALRKGEVDVAQAAPAEAGSLQAEGFRLLEYHSPYYVALAFNCSRVPVEVRQALTCALDRRALVQAVGAGSQEALFPISTASVWYPSDLHSEGVSGGSSTEVLKGRNLRLFIPSGDPHRRQAADAMARALAEAGVQVEVKEEELAGFAARFLPPFDYDLALVVEPFLVNPDLTPLFHSGQIPTRPGQGGNVFLFRDADVDRWLNSFREELDGARRKTLLGQVAEAVGEQVPLYPLWAGTAVFATSPDLSGPVPSPFAWHGNVHEWYWPD